MRKGIYKAPIEVSVSVLSQWVRYLSFLKVDIDRLFWSVGVDPVSLKGILPSRMKPPGLRTIRILACTWESSPVLFGQKHNYITLDSSIVIMPVLAPNASLLEHFENYATNFLSGIEEINNITRAVTKQILSHLDSKTLTIGSIAKEMSISVRTLQNRLKSEGKVFSELLQETREQLAKKCSRENYTVEDITFLLGFSEPSVFRKAFKKWTGSTPKEYREISLANDKHR